MLPRRAECICKGSWRELCAAFRVAMLVRAVVSLVAGKRFALLRCSLVTFVDATCRITKDSISKGSELMCVELRLPELAVTLCKPGPTSIGAPESRHSPDDSSIGAPDFLPDYG
jgi:hypothetical protein